ncbi:MAG: serine/threonine-protein kinase [Myxococcota bacterium]
MPASKLPRGDGAVEASLARLASIAETVPERAGETLVPHLPRRVPSGLRRLTTAPHESLVFEEVLGQGGMAVVHLATQVSLGRKVAVKTLRTKTPRDEDAVRLLREAELTGSLEHPNILPVYDAFLDSEGAPMVALKRIEGVPWRDLIHDEEAARDRFETEDLLVAHLRVLMQVAQAAQFAHARNVVHLDIKPANIMLGEFGEVYLLDWGVAAELDDPDQRTPRELAGTPAYMAPEMLEQTAVGPPTDIYLLGACLYEVLAQRAPHEGPSLGQLVGSVLASSPSFPAQAPVELVAVVQRAMHKRPEARFESAVDFRQALGSFIEHRASRRLTRETHRHLETLLEVSAKESPSADPVDRRARLSRAFGACRFGFGEALRTWPDNRIARQGLLRTLEVEIRFEAEEGSATAAAALIKEMSGHGPVPEALESLVGAAQDREQHEKERQIELEGLARRFDARTELRARWLVTTGLAGLGTVLPLFTQPLVDPASEAYAPLFFHPAVFLTVSLAVALAQRRAIAASAYHRWIASAVIAMLGGQLLVLAAGAVMNLPVLSASAMVALLWSVLSGTLAGAVDRRVAPVSLAYLAVFLGIALLAENRRHANYLMALGHLVTAVTIFVIWRPRSTPKVR